MVRPSSIAEDRSKLTEEACEVMEQSSLGAMRKTSPYFLKASLMAHGYLPKNLEGILCSRKGSVYLANLLINDKHTKYWRRPPSRAGKPGE